MERDLQILIMQKLRSINEDLDDVPITAEKELLLQHLRTAAALVNVMGVDRSVYSLLSPSRR